MWSRPLHCSAHIHQHNKVVWSVLCTEFSSIHDAVDNYVITSGFASRIVMYGGCQCLKSSYFTQLYLKVYLVSVNECCRCCNTFFEVYNYRGTRFDSAPKMMPGPPPYCHPLSRLPTLNFGKTWSQAEKHSYSFCTAILPSCLLS